MQPQQQQRPTPQQILQVLMQMDPEKRADTLNRNPQLRAFIQTMERQRTQNKTTPQQHNQQLHQQHPNQAQLVQQQMSQQMSQQMPQQMAQQIPLPQQQQQQQQQAPPPPPSALAAPPPPPKLDVSTHDKRIVQIPGNIPIDKDLIGNHMKTTNEWSRRMEDQSKDIPMDLKLYEDMISKDKSYQDWAFNTKITDFNGDLLTKMLKDYNYYETVKLVRMKSIGKPDVTNSNVKMWGEGYSGYGNGFTGNKLSLVYPSQSKMGEQRMPKMSDLGTIIPIRLEFDLDRDNFKLNDTLMWNLNDGDDVLVEIVNQMVTDFKIPGNAEMVKKKIIQSFKDQINEYQSIPPVDASIDGCADVRVPIILNITIANNQLNDKFEWALSSTEDQIFEFADLLCEELSLPFEFKTAISHSMTEQCQMFIKSLYMVGYKWDGSAIVSEDIKEHVKVGGIESIFRPKTEGGNYGCNVQELNLDQFEKIIKERERELRRKKRTATRGRRGGFILPDLGDMPSTFRTPIPNGTIPGGADIGVEIDGYNESLHSIEVPMKQQIDRARELERLQRASAHVSGEQERVKRWLRSVVERRMRGASLAAAVRTSPEGSVIIKFAWR